jgi:hypothetical protein
VKEDVEEMKAPRLQAGEPIDNAVEKRLKRAVIEGRRVAAFEKERNKKFRPVNGVLNEGIISDEKKVVIDERVSIHVGIGEENGVEKKDKIRKHRDDRGRAACAGFRKR